MTVLRSERPISNRQQTVNALIDALALRQLDTCETNEKRVAQAVNAWETMGGGAPQSMPAELLAEFEEDARRLNLHRRYGLPDIRDIVFHAYNGVDDDNIIEIDALFLRLWGACTKAYSNGVDELQLPERIADIRHLFEQRLGRCLRDSEMHRLQERARDFVRYILKPNQVEAIRR